MRTFYRPLPPHLTLYMSQLTSTFPISHRISGASLATMVLFSPILCLKIGLICLTYENFYLFSFLSSKFIPSSVGLTIFALSYHLYYGAQKRFFENGTYPISFIIQLSCFYLRYRYFRMAIHVICVLFFFFFPC